MIVVDVTSVAGVRTISGVAFREIVQHVCAKQKIRAAEFSFVVVNDRLIRAINKKFLNHDFVTDVITFPLEQKRIVAEIYINEQQMRRQAKENGVTMKNEMTRLAVHGILHALGYDDLTTAEKRTMDSIQERYVAELSLK
jgi:probable rRNA maturation factor